MIADVPLTRDDVPASAPEAVSAAETPVSPHATPNARSGSGAARHSRARRSQAWTGDTMDLLESVDHTIDAPQAAPARTTHETQAVTPAETPFADFAVSAESVDSAASAVEAAPVEKRSPARRGRRTAAGKIDAVVVPTLLEEAPTPQTVVGEDGSPRKAKPAARARRLRKAVEGESS